MFFDRYEQLCKEIGKSKSAVAIEIGLSKTAVTHWGQGFNPNQETLLKIANYFDISTDYLLGKTDVRRTVRTDITDDDIKFALFGGDTDVTDEMYEEVRRYAEYIKNRKANNE